jgi:hypothetical protein
MCRCMKIMQQRLHRNLEAEPPAQKLAGHLFGDAAVLLSMPDGSRRLPEFTITDDTTYY